MPIDPNEPYDPEDGESDEEAAMRALAARRRAALGQGPADDPAMLKRGSGRPVARPPEFSDPDDATKKQKDVYPGEIAPAMAGAREKIDRAVARLEGFVEKYAKHAIDKFYGSKAGTVKKMDSEFGDMRVGKRGGVQGLEQRMNKDDALKLVDELPDLPQDQAFQQQKSLFHYFHRAIANARREVRDEIRGGMDYQSKPRQVAKKDKEGNIYYDTLYDWETDEYKDKMDKAMEELERDKAQILSDLNLIATASGTLQRATGRYGKADATYLDKKARWMKKPAIIPKQPDVGLSPTRRAQAGPAPEPPEPKGIGSTGREPVPPEIAAQRAQANKPWWSPVERNPKVPERPRPMGLPPRGPVVRKKKQESIDWFLDNIIETAVADRTPQWWDDI